MKKNLIRHLRINPTTDSASTLENVGIEALTLAKAYDCEVEFNYKGILTTVNPYTSINELYSMYEANVRLENKPDNAPHLTLELKPAAGQDISSACETAVHVANTLGVRVKIKFNGLDLFAKPDQNFKEVHHAWCRKLYGTNPKG